RVHHQDQAGGNGDVGGAGLEGIDEGFRAGDEIAKTDPQRHGGEDPQGQRSRKESLREKFPDITNLTNLDVKPLYPLWRIYQVTSMLRAARIILGFPE